MQGECRVFAAATRHIPPGCAASPFPEPRQWSKASFVPHDHLPPDPSHPLADFQALLAGAPAFDPVAAEAARSALDHGGAAGELAAWVAGWRGKPVVRRAIVALYASSYAFAPEGPVWARTRLEHLAQGGGAVNRFARALGAGVEVFDLALDRPVHDAALQSAQRLREIAPTIAFGMEAMAKDPDLLILGDLAPGADRAAAALIAGLTDQPAASLCRAEDLAWTEAALAQARNAAPAHVLDWLAEVGGREMSALTGAILSARASGVPVLLEGLPAAAAALAARQIGPSAVDHVRLAGAVDHPAFAAVAGILGPPVVGYTSSDREGAAGLSALGILRLAHPQ